MGHRLLLYFVTILGCEWGVAYNCTLLHMLREWGVVYNCTLLHIEASLIIVFCYTLGHDRGTAFV